MNLMINDRNHPKQLISTNKEGIPWEEASKAAYSNGLLAGWVRRSRLLNILYVLLCVSVTLTVPVFVLSFTIAVGKLHVDLTVEFLLWLAFPIFLILDVVLGLFYCYISGYKDRKYYVALAEDGKGCWDPVDPSIGYTNLSVPIIVQGRLETFLCVCPEHLWDSACETRDSYFPLALDLDDRFRQFRKVPIPSEVMFLTPERQQEFLANRKDTQIRLLTARVVYATQQIRWLDRLALEKAPEIVLGEQGGLVSGLLDDYRACKDWYEKYRDENIAVLHGVIEKKLADRKSVEQQKLARENIVREKMGITV